MVFLSKQLVLVVLLCAPALAAPVATRIACTDGPAKQAGDRADYLVPRGAALVPYGTEFDKVPLATLIQDMEESGEFPKGRFNGWPEKDVRREYGYWAREGGKISWVDTYRPMDSPPGIGHSAPSAQGRQSEALRAPMGMPQFGGPPVRNDMYPPLSADQRPNLARQSQPVLAPMGMPQLGGPPIHHESYPPPPSEQQPIRPAWVGLSSGSLPASSSRASRRRDFSRESAPSPPPGSNIPLQRVSTIRGDSRTSSTTAGTTSSRRRRRPSDLDTIEERPGSRPRIE